MRLTSYYPLAASHSGAPPEEEALSWSDTRRAVDRARGEVGEWVLVDATPSSCTNIGIYAAQTLFGSAGDFDLVISGPNLGRNTGTAFCVSSGTVGAALAGALCRTRSIAISFGHFAGSPPSLTPGRTEPLNSDEHRLARDRALAYSVELIQHLWSHWDEDTALYSINIPLCDKLAQPETCWTRLWQSTHSAVRRC